MRQKVYEQPAMAVVEVLTRKAMLQMSKRGSYKATDDNPFAPSTNGSSNVKEQDPDFGEEW